MGRTITLTAAQYLEKWNAFSWEIDEAGMAFHALSGASDWQADIMKRLQNPSVPSSPHLLALSVFSNALVTQFFISACRIRETTNSQMSLPKLVSFAESTFPLHPQLVGSMRELLDKTQPTFEKLKRVRSASVAHLNEPKNVFQMLKDNGVTRDVTKEYLEQCLALYALLGKPIGKDFPTDPSRNQAAYGAVSAAYYKLWPL